MNWSRAIAAAALCALGDAPRQAAATPSPRGAPVLAARAVAAAASGVAGGANSTVASDAGVPTAADGGDATSDDATLASRAADPHGEDGARTAALEALARTAGTAALPTAVLCLKAEARMVRLSAARVIGSLGGANARSALQTQLAIETDPEVRTALERALAKSEP